MISHNTRLMTLVDEVERLKSNLNNTTDPNVREAYKIIISEKCDKMRKLIHAFFDSQMKGITNLELDVALGQNLAEGMEGRPLV